MKKYILEFEYESSFNAGSKARNDVNYFLSNERFQLVTLKAGSSKVDKLLQLFTLKKELNKIEDKSVVLIQYPYYKNKLYLQKITQIFAGKKIKTICLIHDLESLRSQKGKDAVNEEINQLSEFDVVISHNGLMTEWLRNNGLQVPIINLDVFDYQTEDFETKSKGYEKNSIAFAGNLTKEKSGFIYKIDENSLKETQLNLYGNGYDADRIVGNINYFGALPPSELPMKIKGGYGLIWDGPSLEQCEGEFGEYMKFNNPHKLSLYIASGLPAIVWKEAAIAEFVNKNELGIAIDSLKELSTILRDIDQQQYESMQMNVKRVRKQVIEGFYIVTAINKSLELF